MQCIKCSSSSLDIVESGPHKKLVCVDCLAFQKFLTKAEAESFIQLKEKK